MGLEVKRGFSGQVVDFTQVWERAADKAMLKRKTGTAWHPELGAWDRIKAILELSWKTAAELIELTGRKSSTVASALQNNKSKLRIRRRAGSGRTREYRLK